MKRYLLISVLTVAAIAQSTAPTTQVPIQLLKPGPTPTAPVAPTGFLVMTANGFAVMPLAQVQSLLTAQIVLPVPQPAAASFTTWDGKTLTVTVPYPFVTGSLQVYLNGVLMSNGSDYSLSGQTITFAIPNTPQPNDIVTLQFLIPPTSPH